MNGIQWFILLISCISVNAQCDPSDPYGILERHNKIRQGIAKGNTTIDGREVKFGGKGSESLFALSYDCSLEGLAYAVIADCKINKEIKTAFNLALNTATTRSGTTKAQIRQAYLYAVEEWLDTAALPLKDAKYRNQKTEAFANMIYHKSLKMGCSHQICSKPNKIAIACVYSRKPQIGEPLYNSQSTKRGCTKQACKAVVSDSKCDATTGLCLISADAIDGGSTNTAKKRHEKFEKMHHAKN